MSSYETNKWVDTGVLPKRIHLVNWLLKRMQPQKKWSSNLGSFELEFLLKSQILNASNPSSNDPLDGISVDPKASLRLSSSKKIESFRPNRHETQAVPRYSALQDQPLRKSSTRDSLESQSIEGLEDIGEHEYPPPEYSEEPVRLQISGSNEAVAQSYKIFNVGKNSTKERQDKLSPATWRMSLELKRSKQDLVDEENRQEREAMIEQTNYQAFSRKYSDVIHGRDAMAEERRWEKKAFQETLEMHSILRDMENETKRRHIRAQHERERVATLGALYRGTTLAGRWQKGAYLGSGPMPAKHPALSTMNCWRDLNFEWDIHGRKHPLDESQVGSYDSGDISAVTQVLLRLRVAFRLKSLHGLDLRRAFREFDTNESGSLTREEFALALQALKIPHTRADVDGIMLFFDPNGNGNVNYGEFMWAFFNHRSVLKKKLASTNSTTSKSTSNTRSSPQRSPKKHQKVKSLRQIKNLFFELDLTGRGVLSIREFKSVFMRLEMTEHMNEVQIERVIRRFDKDGDGMIDYNDFVQFIRAEERAHTISVDRRRNLSQTSQGQSSSRHQSVKEPAKDIAAMSIEIDKTIQKQENIRQLIRKVL